MLHLRPKFDAADLGMVFAGKVVIGKQSISEWRMLK
jgi:hypothetical protein